MSIADFVPWFQGLGAAAGFAGFGWNIFNAVRQNNFKNYENEFKVVEALINSAREAGNAYWMAETRDKSTELKLKILLGDLDSKLSSLQSKGIVRDNKVNLVLLLVDLRKAITSDPFETEGWCVDPVRCAEIRRTADSLLHEFLMRR